MKANSSIILLCTGVLRGDYCLLLQENKSMIHHFT